MRIHVASDLHHEYVGKFDWLNEPVPPNSDADVIVLAGDIHSHTHALDLYGDYPIPVVYVHGNHELYDAEFAGLTSEIRRRAAGTAVVFLQNDETVIQGLRFLGTCLWTDYALHSPDIAGAMSEAERIMPDHQRIRVRGGLLMTAASAREHHRKSVAWLAGRLAQPFGGRTVVVTHHAPSALSIPLTHVESKLAPAFASNLDHLVTRADVWIHGHIHASSDYKIGGCRVVCNPRGYPGKNARFPEVPFQNAAFNPSLVIEV